MAIVYSCCFWFSLRLGGILIGIFSLIQALTILTATCLVHEYMTEAKKVLSHWVHDMQLVYVQSLFESILAGPEKYVTLTISFTCIYILLCLLYIYGAYMCNSAMMLGYILAELLRLISMSLCVVTWLVIVKENSMDIGLLIGASVACGFTMLGMFYLWVCAANLPVLVNEMARDELAATIDKLRQLVEANNLNGYNNNMDEFHTALDRGNMFFIR